MEDVLDNLARRRGGHGSVARPVGPGGLIRQP
jgi:hypothetical protein